MKTAEEIAQYNTDTLSNAFKRAKTAQEKVRQNSVEFKDLEKLKNAILKEIRSRRTPPKGTALEQELRGTHEDSTTTNPDSTKSDSEHNTSNETN